MALIKCSECNKDISDKASFCPHCGCPISKMTDTPSDQTQLDETPVDEFKPVVAKKKNKKIPFIIAGGVLILVIIAILVSSLADNGDSTKISNGIKYVKNGEITGGTEIELAIITDILYLSSDDVLSVFPNAQHEKGKVIVSGTFAGSTGSYKLFYGDDETDFDQVIFERDNDKYDSNTVVDELCDHLGDYLEYDSEWNAYEWLTDDLKLSFYVDERMYFYETRSDNASNKNNSNDESDSVTLSTKSVDEQFSAIQAIFSADSCDEILSIFSDSSTSDSGNIFCDGYFCDIDGTYEILCWENKPYQISFVWESSANVDMDGIVSKLNSTLGEYVRNYEYWGIYEWEKDSTEISVDPEDGVCIEKVFDGGKSECAVDTASVDRSIYMMLSEEEVDYDIGVIKTLMSYRNKPKYTIYEKYPDLIDDDWNQLQMTGTMFGIDGRYCIMYDRETGLISGVGFDWIPDDRETHDNHVVYCLEIYFGECPETDQFYYDKTYYEHDWDRTTLDNWSVHLSTTKDSGWLQFSQLADYVPDDDDLPEERSEANDYDEFIDVITECFKYIPDCDLSFGSEDTGSSNSYAIHAGGDIVGIFGIELDSFDMVSMIDPDKDNADLYHEQMAVAMIMSLDSDMSYEEAKEIFEASKGDSTLFGSGIFCSEGMDSGMKAFGIDITWLS